MDITGALMNLLVALIGVSVPAIIGYVAVLLKEFFASKSAEAAAAGVAHYAEALKTYDAELYSALMEAGGLAVQKVLDETEAFAERDVKPMLYQTAQEISRTFSEKAGVRVDLNEARINTLIELTVREAKKSIEANRV